MEEKTKEVIPPPVPIKNLLDEAEKMTKDRFKYNTLRYGHWPINRDQKSRSEAIWEIMLCTREFVKPTPRSALSRMFDGLVDKKISG